MNPLALSEGRRLLLRLAVAQATVAKAVKVERSLVAKWLSGVRVPSEQVKKRLEVAFDIPPAAWNQRAKKDPAPKPAPPVDPKDLRVDVHARIKQLDLEIAQLMTDRNYKGRERVQMLKAATSMLDLLGKMTGETGITEAKILRSPAWRRLESVLIGALRKHPEARASVAQALDVLIEAGVEPIQNVTLR
jgi:transcriptional regulator with XRE-family HTH domain